MRKYCVWAQNWHYLRYICLLVTPYIAGIWPLFDSLALWPSECKRGRGHNMTREGYGQAYQNGFDITLRFLRSRGVPSERASGVTQGAWGKGWERLEQLQNENMVVTWVNTIALNVYRRVLRNEPVWQDLPNLRTRPAVNLAAIDMARIL